MIAAFKDEYFVTALTKPDSCCEAREPASDYDNSSIHASGAIGHGYRARDLLSLLFSQMLNAIFNRRDLETVSRL